MYIERTQADSDEANQLYGEMAIVDTTGEPDMTRQEDLPKTDLRNILNHFGVGVTQRQPFFGEIDYDTDLQQALQHIGQARRIHRGFETLDRKKYPTWQHLAKAIDDGTFVPDVDSDPSAPPGVSGQPPRADPPTIAPDA